MTEAVASATGNVTLTIGSPVSNNALTCTDVSFDVDTNNVLTIDVANSLLSTCVNNATINAITLDGTSQSTVAESMLSYDGANTLTYTPATDYSGVDTFTYTATNSIVTDSRVVTVNVGTTDNSNTSDSSSSSGAFSLFYLVALLGWITLYRLKASMARTCNRGQTTIKYDYKILF